LPGQKRYVATVATPKTAAEPKATVATVFAAFLSSSFSFRAAQLSVVCPDGAEQS
jgi:hypothetical protein